ncbi:MAG: nitrite reductase (NAD(P)H) small subunit [Planctomycetota bacterium]|nr:MAG: nitrite reductase (NAD(P)H) small subunit [Planctomycetota bacterium]
MSETQPDLFPDEEEPGGAFVTVARVGEIPEGRGRAYPVGKRMIAVFCVEGRYYAIDDFCPHQGASLAEGYLDGCIVACPLHHWRFSIEDGTWMDNTRIKIDAYPVRVVGDRIQVRIPPEE